jgi:hypothetical protein
MARRPDLAYWKLAVDDVVPCLLELGRQLVEEAPWDDSPELDERIRALQARLDRVAADWHARRLTAEAAGDRMREIRLASDMLDVESERRCAAEMRRRGNVRGARRTWRQAERMRRRLWARQRAHRAVLAGAVLPQGQMVLVRSRPRERRGHCRRRASRAPPASDCDGEGPHHVVRRRHGRWAA